MYYTVVTAQLTHSNKNNMKKLFITTLLSLLIAVPAVAAVIDNVRGDILLQVEENGEAWYVYPDDDKRYYLGRPADAFDIMRGLGLGITNADLARIPTSTDSWDGEAALIDRLEGYILLQVEENGEAWYVYPANGKRYYLGRPDDAFEIMRELGLGITNANVETLTIGSVDLTNVSDEVAALESEVEDLINDYRESVGLSRLTDNTIMDGIARQHSENMADGVTPLGHDGFSDRLARILNTVEGTFVVAENVAFATDRPSLAQVVVDGWIDSTGHRENIENSLYELSGVGVAFDSSTNRYYFTQLFASQ